jgi:orotate phosphoribosyltransferase
MGLTSGEVHDLFKETGALLEGHFILTSGLHSNTYFQCAKVFQYPWHGEKLAKMVADHFRSQSIDVVISPAVGGIVVGQEIGRLLGVKAIFSERVDGRMVLRRGFEIVPDENVLVAEDVTTTGGSVKEVIDLARQHGGKIAGVTGIVDRSGGKIDFGLPYFSLLRLDVVTYQPDNCPLCMAGSKAVKPGSRDLGQAKG